MAPSSSSSSSAYAYKPGGSLKFKGGDSTSISKKKKKKSRSSTSVDVHRGQKANDGALIHKERDIDADIPNDSLKSGNDDDDDEEKEQVEIGSSMTQAERKFELIRRQRLAERVAKQAKLSHKDRVDAFNRDLESRTEHFEMGRVGGGG